MSSGDFLRQTLTVRLIGAVAHHSFENRPRIFASRWPAPSGRGSRKVRSNRRGMHADPSYIRSFPSGIETAEALISGPTAGRPFV